MTVPGIGPIISSAMVAAIGNGGAFARGRDFSAWLGLVPKQMSTGDRTILGRISKRGNGYLRMLFMQAARVILLRPAPRQPRFRRRDRHYDERYVRMAGQEVWQCRRKLMGRNHRKSMHAQVSARRCTRGRDLGLRHQVRGHSQSG
jgi:Transposase IS116/IS110/IS902 family